MPGVTMGEMGNPSTGTGAWRPEHRPLTRSTTDMMPIRTAPARMAGCLAAAALGLLLTGGLAERAKAGPLPINGIEEFRTTLLQDRALSGDDPNAASALVDRRR